MSPLELPVGVITAILGFIPESKNDFHSLVLGAEGWELVGTRSVPSTSDNSGQHRTDYFFKRPR